LWLLLTTRSQSAGTGGKALSALDGVRSAASSAAEAEDDVGLTRRQVGVLKADASPLLESAQSSGASRHLVLPSDWSRKLTDNVNVVAPYGAETRKDTYYVARAHLVCSPKTEVAIVARRTGDPATVRDAYISAALSETGCVPTQFDSQVFGDATFALTESPGFVTLAMLIQAESGGSALAMPLDFSLPIMGDLLQAASHLEDRGIAHGDLTENSIYITPDMRALVADFRGACLVASEDESLDCSSFGSALVGSAYRHAPEMVDGHPNDVANNMWQLGLIFARMCFGGPAPTQLEGLSSSHQFKKKRNQLPGQLAPEDRTREGRRRIREGIRAGFSVQDSAPFLSLYPDYKDLMELLASMLEPDPARRVSARQAITWLQSAATRRKVALPRVRPPTALPPAWYDDWQ